MNVKGVHCTLYKILSQCIIICVSFQDKERSHEMETYLKTKSMNVKGVHCTVYTVHCTKYFHKASESVKNRQKSSAKYVKRVIHSVA